MREAHLDKKKKVFSVQVQVETDCRTRAPKRKEKKRFTKIHTN